MSIASRSPQGYNSCVPNLVFNYVITLTKNNELIKICAGWVLCQAMFMRPRDRLLIDIGNQINMHYNSCGSHR